MITDNDHRNGIDAHTENCFGAKGIDMWTIWTIFTWSPPLLSATGWLLLFKLGDLIKIQLIYLFGCSHFPHLVDHKNNKSTLSLFQLNVGNLKVQLLLVSHLFILFNARCAFFLRAGLPWRLYPSLPASFSARRQMSGRLPYFTWW